MTTCNDDAAVPVPDGDEQAVPRPIVQSVPGEDLRVIRSSELFGAQREILIDHGEVRYRLRITHSNKLILTK